MTSEALGLALLASMGNDEKGRAVPRGFFEGHLMGATVVTVESMTVNAKLLDEEPGIQVVQPPPSEEQIRASEAVFSQQEKEANAALGLLGVWTSTVLLHDLALEHFWTSKDDEDEEAKRRRPSPDSEDANPKNR